MEARGAPDTIVQELRDAVQTLDNQGAGVVTPGAVAIVSSQSDSEVRAEARGVVERPFVDVAPALADMRRGCEALMLHINNKACRATTAGAESHIALKVGRRYDLTVDPAL
jgi:hypothetical protein